MELERWPNEAEMIAELYGGAWSNRESWARRCRPEGCIVCTSGHPYGIIADLNHTWITTDPEVDDLWLHLRHLQGPRSRAF